MQTEVLKLYEMTSEDCLEKIAMALTRIVGVSDVVVSLLRSRVTVQLDETRVARSQIEEALAAAGYTARTAREE